MRNAINNYFHQRMQLVRTHAACGAFKRDMTSLFMLSLMLTADEDLAETCLVSSLDDCMTMKFSVNEWARCVLVKNAVELVRPILNVGVPTMTCSANIKPTLRAVMRLKSFERFVFVLTILEGYSDRECSLLLRSSSRHVMATKVQALENFIANLKCTTARGPQLEAAQLEARPLASMPQLAN